MTRIELTSKVIITSHEKIASKGELAEFVLMVEQYLNSLVAPERTPALRFHFDGNTVKVTAATGE